MLNKTDTELSQILEEVKTELLRRANSVKYDDLSIIRGNEMGKRALLVAITGKHSILFVGPPASGKTMLRAVATKFGVVSYECRPCPCGYHNSPTKECSCTARAIEKHRKTIPVADIVIELCPPTQRDLNGRLAGTSTKDLENALLQCAAFDDMTLCQDSQNILKAACTELGIDARQRETIIRVARTIANLDRSPKIKPSHLCEAINYQTYFSI